MLRFMLAAASVVMLPASASAAESIVNGGFEAPVIPGACCSTVPPDALPGWNVTAGNVNVVKGTYGSSAGNLAAEGQQYLDLVGQGGTGALSQTFATVLGQIYSVSFKFSHNLFSPSATSASAAFSVDGLSGTVFHNTGTTADLDWRNFLGSFVASGTSATLAFNNISGGANEGIFLDAVSVQAVPEPGTWAQMLLGFALVGGALRFSRRRKIIGFTPA